jgi:hypothetical protein
MFQNYTGGIQVYIGSDADDFVKVRVEEFICEDQNGNDTTCLTV